MFTLIGMLMMVIYSMNEAGKPENWAWFDKFSKSNNSKDTSGVLTSAVGVNSDNGPTNDTASSQPEATSTSVPASSPAPHSISPTNSTRSKAIGIKAIRLSEDSPTFTRSPQPTALPTESARFWSAFFDSLTTEEKIEWMDLLQGLQRDLRKVERSSSAQTQARLIAVAQQRRDDFDNKLRDRMSSIPLGSEKRTQVSQDYFEADKFWQNRIFPALTAALKSQDLTLSQRQAVVDLLHHLDADALNLVQDKTAVGWTGDSVAWKRAWNRIHQSQLGEPAFGEPTFVKRIQLIGQPREFRGRAVTVYGFVRAVETRTELGTSSIAGPAAKDTDEVTYYILWVQPSNSTVGPYCVYCLTLPAELPRSREKLAKFDQMATINGVFFKNRSYQLADRSVDYAPLILTDGFELKPSLNWTISPAWMAAAIAFVPVLGVGIVWYAVRSTVSRKRLPSKKSQKEIDVFLGDLKNDPAIKTDQEKIQAISEHEDDIL